VVRLDGLAWGMHVAVALLAVPAAPLEHRATWRLNSCFLSCGVELACVCCRWCSKGITTDITTSCMECLRSVLLLQYRA
jgi:hypothetical protein